MKKLLLLVGVFALFLVATPVYAECAETDAWSFCLSGGACSVGSKHYCCDGGPTECDEFKGPSSTQPDPAKIEDLCKYAGEKYDECFDAFSNGDAWTAIGRIPTTPQGFIEKFLGLGIGIAGGIAFLLILFSGFQMLTSIGNPEKLNAGKELLTSAISGLVLIIFSIFLLRLIGVDILGLPGFGGSDQEKTINSQGRRR